MWSTFRYSNLIRHEWSTLINPINKLIGVKKLKQEVLFTSFKMVYTLTSTGGVPFGQFKS